MAEIIVTKWYLTLDWVGGVNWKLSGSRSGHADRCLFATLYFPRGKRFFFPHWNLNFVRYKVEPYILAPSPWIVIRSFYFVFVISCDKNFSQPCFLTHLDFVRCRGWVTFLEIMENSRASIKWSLTMNERTTRIE